MTRRPSETIGEWVARCDARAERLEVSPHFVYRAFDSFGLLLYVGCTNSVKTRMGSHRSGSQWHRFAETLGVAEYRTRTAARTAESAAISAEGAYFNSTQEDILRTLANRNAAKQSLWSRGWYRPMVGDDVDHRDEAAWSSAWAAIEVEVAAWDRAVHRAQVALKSGRFPYMTDADRLGRYLAARGQAAVETERFMRYREIA